MTNHGQSRNIAAQESLSLAVTKIQEVIITPKRPDHSKRGQTISEEYFDPPESVTGGHGLHLLFKINFSAAKSILKSSQYAIYSENPANYVEKNGIEEANEAAKSRPFILRNSGTVNSIKSISYINIKNRVDTFWVILNLNFNTSDLGNGTNGVNYNAFYITNYAPGHEIGRFPTINDLIETFKSRKILGDLQLSPTQEQAAFPEITGLTAVQRDEYLIEAGNIYDDKILSDWTRNNPGSTFQLKRTVAANPTYGAAGAASHTARTTTNPTYGASGAASHTTHVEIESAYVDIEELNEELNDMMKVLTDNKAKQDAKTEDFQKFMKKQIKSVGKGKNILQKIYSVGRDKDIKEFIKQIGDMIQEERLTIALVTFLPKVKKILKSAEDSYNRTNQDSTIENTFEIFLETILNKFTTNVSDLGNQTYSEMLGIIIDIQGTNKKKSIAAIKAAIEAAKLARST